MILEAFKKPNYLKLSKTALEEKLLKNTLDGKSTVEIIKQIDDIDKIIQNRKFKCKLSPDVIITTIGSLAGILMITKFEQTDILTSKAINQVLKWRV